MPVDQTNSLATLSMVFAFFFAPAGAILGHLALSQIKRTAQRGHERALIGITLSYVVIISAVVVLSVWVVAGDASDQTRPAATSAGTASPTATSVSTSPTSTTLTSTTQTRPTGPALPGPTLPSSNPPDPLLDIDEMKTLMGQAHRDYNPPPAIPVPDLLAYPEANAPEPVAGTQGTISDLQCGPAFFAGTTDGLDGLGYQRVDMVTMGQPGPQGTQSVTEAALYFDNPAAAAGALDAYVRRANACRDRDMQLTSAGSGTTYQIEMDKDGLTQFTFTDADEQKVYMTNHNEAHRPGDNYEDDGKFSVARAVAVKNNVLVDVSVRGLNLSAHHQALIYDMLQRL